MDKIVSFIKQSKDNESFENPVEKRGTFEFVWLVSFVATIILVAIRMYKRIHNNTEQLQMASDYLDHELNTASGGLDKGEEDVQEKSKNLVEKNIDPRMLISENDCVITENDTEPFEKISEGSSGGAPTSDDKIYHPEHEKPPEASIENDIQKPPEDKLEVEDTIKKPIKNIVKPTGQLEKNKKNPVRSAKSKEKKPRFNVYA